MARGNRTIKRNHLLLECWSLEESQRKHGSWDGEHCGLMGTERGAVSLEVVILGI